MKNQISAKSKIHSAEELNFPFWRRKKNTLFSCQNKLYPFHRIPISPSPPRPACHRKATRPPVTFQTILQIFKIPFFLKNPKGSKLIWLNLPPLPGLKLPVMASIFCRSKAVPRNTLRKVKELRTIKKSDYLVNSKKKHPHQSYGISPYIFPESGKNPVPYHTKMKK